MARFARSFPIHPLLSKFFFPPGTVTTTQNQTGVSRIQVTDTKTQTGVARLTATTTQNQTGKGNIRNTTTKTQTGVTRIQVTDTKTQTGVARLTDTTTQTQAGLSRIAATSQKTQTGHTRVTATTTQNQTGKGAISNTTTKTQAGVARLQETASVRENYIPNPSYESDTPGNGNVPNLWTDFGSTGITYKGVANSFSQYGSNSYEVSNTTAMDGGVWTQITGLPLGATVTLSAWIKSDGTVSNGSLVLDTSQHGAGGSSTISNNVGANFNGRQSVSLKLDATAVNIFIGQGSFGGTSSGTVYFDGLMLEVSNDYSNSNSYFDGSTDGATWSGTHYASTSTIPVRFQLGLARIQQVVNKPQTGLARITATTPQTISGKARVTNATTKTQTGKGDIVIARTKTQPGKANVLGTTTQTQRGKAMILSTHSKPLPPVILIDGNPAIHLGGIMYIKT